jgi:hypothetical protein
MMKKRFIVIQIMSFILLISLNAFSATVTWTGTTSTDWGTATNWDTTTVPSGNDDVVIPYVAANHPLLDTARTINSLTIATDGRLDLSGFNLTVNGDLTINGILDASTGSPTITVWGNWDSSGGTFDYGMSTVVLTGDNKTIITPSSSSFGPVIFHNLTIDGSVSNTNKFKVANELTISDTGSLTLGANLVVYYTGTLIMETDVSGSGGTLSTGNYTLYRFANNDSPHLSISEQAKISGTVAYLIEDDAVPVTVAHYDTLKILGEGPASSNYTGVLECISGTTCELQVDASLFITGLRGYINDKVKLRKKTGHNISLAIGRDLSIGSGKATAVFDLGDGEISVGRHVKLNNSTGVNYNEIIAGNSRWHVSGDWINSGNAVFTADHSTVIFNGTSNQNVTGNNTFYNLIVSNTGDTQGNDDSVIVSDYLTVSNNLSIVDGRFDGAGEVILNGGCDDNNDVIILNTYHSNSLSGPFLFNNLTISGAVTTNNKFRVKGELLIKGAPDNGALILGDDIGIWYDGRLTIESGGLITGNNKLYRFTKGTIDENGYITDESPHIIDKNQEPYTPNEDGGIFASEVVFFVNDNSNAAPVTAIKYPYSKVSIISEFAPAVKNPSAFLECPFEGERTDFSGTCPVDTVLIAGGGLVISGLRSYLADGVTLDNSIHNIDISADYLSIGGGQAFGKLVAGFASYNFRDIRINTTDSELCAGTLDENNFCKCSDNDGDGYCDSGSPFFNVSGNWTNDGSFVSGASSVYLTGIYQSIKGSNDFYNLSKKLLPEDYMDVLYFEEGTTQNIVNLELIAPNKEQPLFVRSSRKGALYTINVTDLYRNNVDIADSNISGDMIYMPGPVSERSFPLVAGWFNFNWGGWYQDFGSDKEQVLDYIADHYSLVYTASNARYDETGQRVAEGEADLLSLKEKNPDLLALGCYRTLQRTISEEDSLRNICGVPYKPWDNQYLVNRTLTYLNSGISINETQCITALNDHDDFAAPDTILDSIFLDSFTYPISNGVAGVSVDAVDSEPDGLIDSPSKLDEDWKNGLVNIVKNIRESQPYKDNPYMIVANVRHPLEVSEFAYEYTQDDGTVSAMLDGILTEELLNYLTSDNAVSTLKDALRWSNDDSKHLIFLDNYIEGKRKFYLYFAALANAYSAVRENYGSGPPPLGFPEYEGCRSLGRPFGPTFTYSDYWMREFENGTVYLNPYSVPVDIDINDDGYPDISLSAYDADVNWDSPLNVYSDLDINSGFIDLKKAEIEWDDVDGTLTEVKMRGELALNCVDYYELNPAGMVKVGISSEPELINQSVYFTVKGDSGNKWEYKSGEDGLGLNKFKIDWKGAKFDYNGDIRIESEHIGFDSVEIEIDRKGITEPVTIAVNDVIIGIDSSGHVSTQPVTLEVDVDEDEDGEIEVDLPFTLTQDTVFTIMLGEGENQTVDTAIVADYYTFAHGKYQVKAYFNNNEINGNTRPATFDITMGVGDQGFIKSYHLTESDWKELKTNEWKYKKSH